MDLEQKIVEMQLKSFELDAGDIGLEIMQRKEMEAAQVLKNVLNSTISGVSSYTVNFTRNFVTNLKNAINSKIATIRTIIKAFRPEELTKDVL